MLHQLHNAKGAPADHRFHPQVLHGDVQVLQVHTMLQLFAEGADNVGEDAGLQAETGTSILRTARRRALLARQQAALTEVVPPAKVPHQLAVLGDLHGATVDEVEVDRLFSLLHYNVPGGVRLSHQGPGSSVHLFIWQVLEQEDVAQHLLELAEADDLAQRLAQGINNHGGAEAVQLGLRECHDILCHVRVVKHRAATVGHSRSQDLSGYCAILLFGATRRNVLV
mmetsp:Transcript_16481/g.38629  ORF Transcript_16481/g.38629 Transcript_16481/m.38629 type:complete len:225 (+) Transcript_16481:1027-1701(+)